ncbi:cytochrome P450 [Aspergillus recurvatus]
MEDALHLEELVHAPHERLEGRYGKQRMKVRRVGWDNLVNLTEDLFKQYLVAGPPFAHIVESYQGALDELLSWDRLVFVFPSLVGAGAGRRTEPISLYDMCTDIVVNANQRILFDPVLLAIDSDMAVEVRTFTDGLWKLFHRSRFADTADVTKLLHRYTSVFKRYLQLPPQSRKSEMRAIRTLIEMYSELGIHEDDQAAVLLMIWWAASAIAYRAAFWVLAYIVHDSGLREIVRQETAPAVGLDGTLDWPFLTKKCPRLFSIYREALRLTKRDLIIRKVVRDTTVGGKRLRRGSIAVIPPCQLHDNLETYGSDATSFNPDRFLKNEDLANNNRAFLAFGGGRHYCPGHQVAALEILGRAAVMINRFDIKLAGPTPLPRRDDSLITMGISRPVPGDDLDVTLAWESRGS